MLDGYTIGQIASHFGVQTHAIRDCIARLNLRPCGRSGGGWRRFDHEALLRIQIDLVRLGRIRAPGENIIPAVALAGTSEISHANES